MDERAKPLRVAAVFKVTHVDIKVCHDSLAAAQGFIDVFSHGEGLPAAGPSVYKIDHNGPLSFSGRTENMLFAACYERQDIDAGCDLLDDKAEDDLLYDQKDHIKEHAVQPCKDHVPRYVQREEPVQVL